MSRSKSRMMPLAGLLLGLGLSMPLWASESLPGEEAYQAAFQDMVLSTLLEQAQTEMGEAFDEPELQQDLRAYAQAIAQCHMASIAHYDPEFRSLAYDVVAQGGDFTAADEALQDAMLAVVAEGGQGAQTVMTAAYDAQTSFDRCMNQPR